MSKSYIKIIKYAVVFLFVFAAITIICTIIPSIAAKYHPADKNALHPDDEIYCKNPSVFGLTESKKNETTDNRMTQERPLGLILRGTINGGMGNAQAVIEDKVSRIQKIYKKGDTIVGGTLTKIMKQKVIIRINGTDKVLALTHGTCTETEKNKEVCIYRSELNLAIGDAKKLISDINLKPHQFNDGTKGLRIEDVVPGSLFEKLSFKDGDIIREINGTKIKNPRRLVAIYNGLKRVPIDILTLKDVGSKSEKVIRWIDNRAGGVIKEVSKVYQKTNFGEDIPLKFVRNGTNQTVMLSVK